MLSRELMGGIWDQLKSFWLTLDDTATGLWTARYLRIAERPRSRFPPQSDHSQSKQRAPSLLRPHCCFFLHLHFTQYACVPPFQQRLFYVLSSCSFKWLGQTTSDNRRGGWEGVRSVRGSDDLEGRISEQGESRRHESSRFSLKVSVSCPQLRV